MFTKTASLVLLLTLIVGCDNCSRQSNPDILYDATASQQLYIIDCYREDSETEFAPFKSDEALRQHVACLANQLRPVNPVPMPQPMDESCWVHGEPIALENVTALAAPMIKPEVPDNQPFEVQQVVAGHLIELRDNRLISTKLGAAVDSIEIEPGNAKITYRDLRAIGNALFVAGVEKANLDTLFVSNVTTLKGFTIVDGKFVRGATRYLENVGGLFVLKNQLHFSFGQSVIRPWNQGLHEANIPRQLKRSEDTKKFVRGDSLLKGKNVYSNRETHHYDEFSVILNCGSDPTQLVCDGRAVLGAPTRAFLANSGVLLEGSDGLYALTHGASGIEELTRLPSAIEKVRETKQGFMLWLENQNKYRLSLIDFSLEQVRK